MCERQIAAANHDSIVWRNDALFFMPEWVANCRQALALGDCTT